MKFNKHHLITIAASGMLLLNNVYAAINPSDPYENMNRKIYKFNSAFDATMLKPVAKLYQAILPQAVQHGINNAYNNIDMLPTVANDLLQAEWNYAIKDTWRFLINSIFGIAGIFDAASHWGLPVHYTDLGITFAKWGDKNSPYLMIPLLGPSTFRDGMGMMFDYALFTPYPWIPSDKVVYSLLGIRYIDLRVQMFEPEKLMHDAIDKYAFMRDAYLQHRNYLITGEQQQDTGELYVDESEM